MNLLDWIHPLSFFLGILLGTSYGVFQSKKAKRWMREKEQDFEEKTIEIGVREDMVLTQMVDSANEWERSQELLGHLQYKSKQIDEEKEKLGALKKQLQTQSADLAQEKQTLEKREQQFEGQRKKMEEQLKGARARARRISKKNPDNPDN